MDRSPIRPPRRVAGLPFPEFVQLVAEAVHRRAFTAKLRREFSAHELRQLRVWQETVLNRSRLINLEENLARRPELRELVRSCPVNLKRLSAASIPFPEPLWSRAGEGAGEELLARTPTGARLGSRLDEALEYLRAHPQASVPEVARRFHVAAVTLRKSPRYRELLHARDPGDGRLLRWFRGGHSSGVDRALAYLATHRPRNLTEIAFATDTSASNLCGSPRFRQVWDEYKRKRKL